MGLFATLVLKRSDQSVNKQLSEQSKSTEIYEWDLVTSWPKNFPGLGT
ncbi:MAG: hypothetical protein ACI93R_003193, partial [Flavobacteriales bacterium]